MNWFERLTGFREEGYEATRNRLEVIGESLSSKVNGRSYGVGLLEVVSLGELRRRATPMRGGRLRVSTISGDVREMHKESIFACALFQVASQFNLLEMVSPDITPERGVTIYQRDPTQGPACAIAAGAATIYRNYFVPVGGQVGQTSNRQIDCLSDVGEALGNKNGSLWEMKNGYALCSENGLEQIREHLVGLSEEARDALRCKLKIGTHWNVQVTDVDGGDVRVSQAFCSALPVAYGRPAPHKWASLATLILEAAYEASLCAAVLNKQRYGSGIVLLTRLGGGAFGNAPQWIQDAMTRALTAFRGYDLDVRLVCRGPPDKLHHELVEAFGKG